MFAIKLSIVKSNSLGLNFHSLALLASQWLGQVRSCRPLVSDTTVLRLSATETIYFNLDRSLKCCNPSFYSKHLNLIPPWVSLGRPWHTRVHHSDPLWGLSKWATITTGYCNYGSNIQVKTLTNVWQRRWWWTLYLNWLVVHNVYFCAYERTW